MAEDRIATIHTRPGVELGEATQEEIALAVIAGTVQRLRAGAPKVRPVTAPDPTSGSEILGDDQTPSVEHEGVTYDRSCNGCKGRSLEDPAKYVGAATG